MTMRDQVLEFMKKHEQGAATQFLIPEQDITLLRVRLIQEEHAELIVALHENDILKVMDACADLRYVVVGTSIAYGFNCLDHFGASSESRALPAHNPSPYVKVNYYHRLNERIFLLIKALAKSTQMLSFLEVQQLSRDLTRLTDEVLREIAFFDALYNIPGSAVFAEVHRSNMTKNKLDKHSKGGKVSKKGFEPPNFKQFCYEVQ